MVANKPGHQGEPGGSRNTIAQGMSDSSGEPVVTNARAIYHTTRGCGCTGHPAFPAPSSFRAEVFSKNPGKSRRGIEKPYPIVPARRHASRSRPLAKFVIRYNQFTNSQF